MHKVSIIILFLTIFFGFLKAQNTDSIIVLNDETEILNIGKQVYYLEDKEGKLTIEDIQKPEYQKQFKRSEQEILNFGFNNHFYWLKLTCKQLNLQKSYKLLVESSLLSDVDFFWKENNQLKQEKAGFKIPILSKKDANNFQSVEFNNVEQIGKDIYIRIKNTSVPFALYFSENGKLNRYINLKNIFTVFITGILYFVVVFNLEIALRQKKLIYLIYASLIFCYLLTNVVYSGLLNFFLTVDTQHLLLFLGCITGLNSFWYTYQYLNLRSLGRNRHFILMYFYIYMIFTILVIFFWSEETKSALWGFSQLYGTFAYLAYPILGLFMWQLGNKDALYYFTAYTLFFLFLLSEILHLNGLIPHVGYNTYIDYAYCFEAFILAYGLNMKFERERKQLEKEKAKAKEDVIKLIKEQNEVLEEKVQEKTFALREQAEELKVTNEEMQVVNEELNSTVEELGLTLETLDTQKKIVESINRKITASISYAQTIQQAVLPDKLILESYLQDYFLLYRPKDIVSGDFYWVAPIRRGYVVAVADCTGHGVAGSFMSLVGINLLGKMEDELETLSPAEMIRRLNIGVDKALKQDERQSYNEGMDIGIVRVEKEGNSYTLTFAGAKRPLYYISKEERKLQEIAGDRFSVGIGTQREIFIQNHTLALKTGDSFYLLSDGLADQNNEKRKRLGENILKETLQNLFDQESNTQLQQLEKLLDEHQGTAEQRDDITLLGVKL